MSDTDTAPHSAAEPAAGQHAEGTPVAALIGSVPAAQSAPRHAHADTAAVRQGADVAVWRLRAADARARAALTRAVRIGRAAR